MVCFADLKKSISRKTHTKHFFVEISNKVLEVINQYMFWNFYINRVGNIQ